MVCRPWHSFPSWIPALRRSWIWEGAFFLSVFLADNPNTRANSGPQSSLIHAIAGELMLDIYVVSLSSSWINDSTLTTLMGRVPARCIVLLEDLDAAFTRSVTRDDESTGTPGSKKDGETQGPSNDSSGTSRHRSRNKEALSDVNTLSLSGLLNALDGVAAAEGRLLFATTNHLERLDPALSRPGRMDVWIEFKNASKWQAQQLFRNFFPSTEDEEDPIDEAALDAALAGVDLNLPDAPVGTPRGPGSTVSTGESVLARVGLAPSGASTSSLSSLPSMSGTSSTGSAQAPPERPVPSTPAEEHAIRPTAVPLSAARLTALARQFGEGIPDEEFSVAALQGYLLKNKTRPEAAASEAAAWVVSEREMREKMKREKAAREAREKTEVSVYLT